MVFRKDPSLCSLSCPLSETVVHKAFVKVIGEKDSSRGLFLSLWWVMLRVFWGTRPFSSHTLLKVTLERVVTFLLGGLPSVALSHPLKLWVTLKCQSDGHVCLQFTALCAISDWNSLQLQEVLSSTHVNLFLKILRRELWCHYSISCHIFLRKAFLNI